MLGRRPKRKRHTSVVTVPAKTTSLTTGEKKKQPVEDPVLAVVRGTTAAVAVARPRGHILIKHFGELIRVPRSRWDELKELPPEGWLSLLIERYSLPQLSSKDRFCFAVVPHHPFIVAVWRESTGLTVQTVSGRFTIPVPAHHSPFDWSNAEIVAVEYLPSSVAMLVLIQLPSKVMVEIFAGIGTDAKQATYERWTTPSDSGCPPFLKQHAPAGVCVRHHGNLSIHDPRTGKVDVPPIAALNAALITECTDDGALAWIDHKKQVHVADAPNALPLRDALRSFDDIVYVPATHEFAYPVHRSRVLELTQDESKTPQERQQLFEEWKQHPDEYGVGFTHRQTGAHRTTWLHDRRIRVSPRLYNASSVVASDNGLGISFIINAATPQPTVQMLNCAGDGLTVQ